MDIPTLETIRDNFIAELKDAEAGKKTSLPFIRHTLPSSPIVKDDEAFQVMVIGGTIFRKAIMKKQDGKLRIVKKEEKNQPPFVRKGDFLHYAEKEIDPKVSVLALNLAYPLSPVFLEGVLDGVLLSGMKENVLDEIINKQVGNTIETQIQKSRGQKMRVSVANDTICLLLSGLTKYPAENLAGGIVGTGINFALFLDDHTVVNLESANFNKLDQSITGKIVDLESLSPGKSILEKETAGAYLYKHYNALWEKHHFPTDRLHSTQELDQIAQQDIKDASLAAKKLLRNSAELVAAQIAAICEYKKRDLTFVVEGSLFWQADGYRQHIKHVLQTLLPAHAASFVRVDNSTLLGAAKLVA